MSVDVALDRLPQEERAMVRERTVSLLTLSLLANKDTLESRIRRFPLQDDILGSPGLDALWWKFLSTEPELDTLPEAFTQALGAHITSEENRQDNHACMVELLDDLHRLAQTLLQDRLWALEVPHHVLHRAGSPLQALLDTHYTAAKRPYHSVVVAPRGMLHQAAETIHLNQTNCVPFPGWEAMETVLGLWNPRSTGVLCRLPGALEAAQLV